jgi:hypothetical protein
MSVQSPPPTYAPPPPQKKGMGALAWVAIGCGVIVLIIVAVLAAGGMWVKHQADRFKDNPEMAAAELVVNVNPDLEMVSKDEKAGTITVRNKKTNEVVTANVGEIKTGHFKFTSDKGSASFDVNSAAGMGSLKVTDEKGKESTMNFGAGAPKSLPSWVPMYSGGINTGSYASDGAQGKAGGFSMTTNDPVDKVMDFYESQLKSGGFKTQRNTYDNSTSHDGAITGTSDDQKRTVSVIVTHDTKGDTKAVVVYSEKP